MNRLQQLAAGLPERDSVIYGVVPAVVAVPLIVRVWAPTWFVIGWTAVYVAVSVFFVAAAHRNPLERDFQWTTWEAVMFALIPISTVLWGTADHFWMAAAAGLVFVAYALSELPSLDFDNGWVGPSLVALSISICGLFMVHPLISVAGVPLLGAIISATNSSRNLKMQLVHHLDIAEETVLYDSLTGLLSRRGLGQRIDRLDGELLTVTLIDLDRFKLVNDTYGHQVGDQVLAAVAATLSQRFGSSFDIARLGGDEFVGVAAGQQEISELAVAPIEIAAVHHENPLQISVTISIGVSSGVNTEGAANLLSEAGYAMREAKRAGGGIAFFSGDLAHQRDTAIEVASIANSDADAGEFVPMAQTIVANDHIVGCALVVRLRRSDGELLSPEHFMPMAVEAGLMATINNLMVKNAVEFAARFNNRPAAPFVSVNICSALIRSADFYKLVEQLLKENRVSGARLMLETNEAIPVGGYDEWAAGATRLRALGVHLAMGDFGVGHTSLNLLPHLPVSHLKFDPSLARAASGPFGEVLGGISRFAKATNIGLIADGVETLDELEAMRAIGINSFQGSFFHQPETLHEVELLVIDDQQRLSRSNEA